MTGKSRENITQILSRMRDTNRILLTHRIRGVWALKMADRATCLELRRGVTVSQNI